MHDGTVSEGRAKKMFFLLFRPTPALFRLDRFWAGDGGSGVLSMCCLVHFISSHKSCPLFNLCRQPINTNVIGFIIIKQQETIVFQKTFIQCGIISLQMNIGKS